MSLLIMEMVVKLMIMVIKHNDSGGIDEDVD